MDVCLRVLKESNKSGSTATALGNSVLIISHITFRGCRVHVFPDNLSRIAVLLSQENLDLLTKLKPPTFVN